MNAGQRAALRDLLLEITDNLGELDEMMADQAVRSWIVTQAQLPAFFSLDSILNIVRVRVSDMTTELSK